MRSKTWASDPNPSLETLVREETPAGKLEQSPPFGPGNETFANRQTRARLHSEAPSDTLEPRPLHSYEDERTEELSTDLELSSARTDRVTVLPTDGFLASNTNFPQLKFPMRRRYETKRQLGSGSMGLVDLAIDTDIQREVAVKKLRRSSDPAAIARMTDEIRIAGQLEHPNIVPIHDVGINAEGDYFFVMRLVHGLTLRDIMDGLGEGDDNLSRRFHFAERIRIFRDIVEAVAFAHSQGVLHQDLKPENLMVGVHGEVFVMDWGLATYLSAHDRNTLEEEFARDAPNRKKLKLRQRHIPTAPVDPKTRSGVVQGTPFYMAPEQTRGESSMSAEVYTLSVILHEWLGLRHYLEHRSGLASVLEGVRSDPIDSLHKANPAPNARVPVEWAHFISKGVGKKPEQRFSSVNAMLATLNKVDEGLFPVECPTTFTKRFLRELLRAVDRFPIAAYLIPLGMVMTLIATITSYFLG